MMMMMMMDPLCDADKNKETKKLTSLGKRKIEIKKIEKPSNRSVTFTKRRGGLFKKAAELSTLSGAHVAVLVESFRGNKVYSFGHPNVDSVIHRYLNQVQGHDPEIPPPPQFFSTDYDDDMMMPKKKLKTAEDGGNFWWNMDVQHVDDVEELEKHLRALEELKKNVTTRANELIFDEYCSSPLPLPPPPPPPTNSDCFFLDQFAAEPADIVAGGDDSCFVDDCFFLDELLDDTAVDSCTVNNNDMVRADDQLTFHECRSSPLPLLPPPPTNTSDCFFLDEVVAEGGDTTVDSCSTVNNNDTVKADELVSDECPTSPLLQPPQQTDSSDYSLLLDQLLAEAGDTVDSCCANDDMFWNGNWEDWNIGQANCLQVM